MLEEGNKIFVRTVTYHHIGKVKKISDKFVELEDAWWVANSGIFSNALKNGNLESKEKVGDVSINIDSIVDIFPWNHEL